MLIGFRLALRGRLCVMNGDGTQGTIVYSRDKLLTFYFSEKELQDCSLLKMPTFEYESCIRGYHVYQSIWSSSVGEVLSCRQEPRNAEDPFATGVYKGVTLVGHVPRKISCVFSLFLRRGGVITARVTGSRQYSRDLPQGGLELPCVYLLEGEANSVEKAHSRLLTLASAEKNSLTSSPVKDEPASVVNPLVATLDETESKERQIPASSEWTKTHDIVLMMDDRQLILSGQRLTDKHINFAQRLIQDQFKHLNGLRLTLIQDKPYTGSKKHFLQVLFVKEGHWVVLASQDGKLFKVYDSLYQSLDEKTQTLISQQTGPHHEAVVSTTQRQNGTHDCGLFAIAFAMSIACGEDPSKRTYNQDLMREHLVDCFSKKVVQLFP